MKKLSFTILTSIFLCTKLFAFDSPYFNGYAGFLGQARSDPISDYVDPMFYAQGYFGGEINIANRLTLRSEFFMRTSDLIGEEILQNPDSEGTLNGTFKVQELSATYRINSSSAVHYISAFFGDYEPIGSDIFLQRYFGIKPITSSLTESLNGRNGSSINGFYGAGVSYVIRFEQPVAVGFYIYEDFFTSNDYLSQRKFNTDLRLAFAFPFFTLDFSAGLGFPADSTEGSFDTQFLIVRYVTLHSGFDLLIGSDSDSTSVFVQAGVSDVDILVDAESNEDLVDDIIENLYFLIEPRLTFGNIQFTFALFNIPQPRLLNLVYVFDSLGIDASISTDAFHLGNMNYTLGMHATISANTTIKDVIDDSSALTDADYTFRLIPYTSIPLLGGTLTSSMAVNMTELFKFKDNWMSNFILSLGFDTTF